MYNLILLSLISYYMMLPFICHGSFFQPYYLYFWSAFWLNGVMACQVLVQQYKCNSSSIKQEFIYIEMLKRNQRNIFIRNLICSSWVLYLVSDVYICLESHLLKTVNIDIFLKFHAAIFL